MGFFDVSMNKEVKVSKEEILTYLKKEFTPLCNETTIENKSILFQNFKAKGTLLTYDLNINIEKTKDRQLLEIDGELLNVWILVIIIVLGILFTYGIGVILIVGFAYYQKVAATKYINKILENT